MMLNLRSKTQSIQPVSVPSTPAPGAAPSVFQSSLRMSAMQQPGGRIQHDQNINGVALSTTTPGRHVWPSTGGHHLSSPFRENSQSGNSSSSVRDEIVTPIKPSSQLKTTENESRVEDGPASDTQLVQSNQEQPTPINEPMPTQPPSGSDVTPDSTSNPTPDASQSTQSHDVDTTPGDESTPDGSSMMGMAQLLTALQTDSQRQNEQTTQAAQAAWTDVSSQIHSQTQMVQALMRRKQAVEEQVEQQLQLLLETVDPSAAAAFRSQLKSAVESAEHDTDLVGSSDACKHVSLFASLMNNAYSVDDDENVAAFASELAESTQPNHQPTQSDRVSEAASESVQNADERLQSLSYAEQDDLALQTMARALRTEREASHAIKADHARLEQRVKDVMEEKAELLAAFKSQIEQLSAERDSVTQQLNDAQKELQTSQQRFKEEVCLLHYFNVFKVGFFIVLFSLNCRL
jgi:DNA-binding ferritin-like protein